jgi:hypothetical protein
VIQDFKVVCYGDCDGSYLPPTKSEPAVTITESGTLEISSDGSVSIPVLSGQEASIGSVSLVINVLRRELECSKVTSSLDGTLLYSQFENQIRIAWYSLTPANLGMGAELLRIHGKVSGGFNGISLTAGPESSITNEDAAVFESFPILVPRLESLSNTVMVSQNVPNPFTNETSIWYFVPKEATINLTIYSATGQVLRKTCMANVSAGHHSLVVQALEEGAGVYYYQFDIQTVSQYFRKVDRIVQVH